MNDMALLDNISSDQALMVLKKIWVKGGEFRKSIESEIEGLLRNVNVDEIVDDIIFALGSIDVHDLWDRSGPSSNGYSSPEDMAVEMIEEELAPFYDQMDRYHELGMYEEEKLQCMGVLKGLYDYEKGADSEFSDWASDISAECFSFLLKKWTQRSSHIHHKKEMTEFVQVNCPDWVK